MKYTMFIDQIHSIEWGLNLQEAAIFNFLYSVPTWAEAKLIDGKLFYHASRNKAIQDYPIVSEKPDTIYRIYRRLQSAGVIEWMKDGLKDMILITDKGKQWNSSEKNPTFIQELGKKSDQTRKKIRNSSENFPTYTSTIYNHTILLDKEEVENEFSTVLIDSEEDLVMEIHHVPDYFEEDTSKSASDLVDIFYAELNSKATQKPKEKSSAKKEKVTSSEDMDLVYQVVTYLNEKTEQAFQPGGEKTKSLILARHHADKWSLEDFAAVIDHKKSEWFVKDNLRQYLRPSTLFAAGHAEEYLQAAKLWKKKPVATSPGVVPLFRQENFANTDRSKFKF